MYGLSASAWGRGPPASSYASRKAIGEAPPCAPRLAIGPAATRASGETACTASEHARTSAAKVVAAVTPPVPCGSRYWPRFGSFHTVKLLTAGSGLSAPGGV